MNDRDLDAEFQRIVAGWDDEAPDPVEAGRSGMPSGEDPAPAGDGLTSDDDTAAPRPRLRSTRRHLPPLPCPDGPGHPGGAWRAHCVGRPDRSGVHRRGPRR